MNVRNFMTQVNAMKIHASWTIPQILRLLPFLKDQYFLIVDQDKSIGLVRKLELVERLKSEKYGEDITIKTIKEFCEGDFCYPNEDVFKVLSYMRSKSINFLQVKEKDAGDLLGVLEFDSLKTSMIN